ncbi:unnamed protein product [Rangifer tarandus platyrhynchus]|uniref:Uncharacterized protein n=1 Tax=Rangifer tarandus platyrhynchus TaxID=3082113 RepID=A0ABN8YJR3_RANTA|nr:unnamed protein product [Rangifer tarandus platyrhynchus]
MEGTLQYEPQTLAWNLTTLVSTREHCCVTAVGQRAFGGRGINFSDSSVGLPQFIQTGFFHKQGYLHLSPPSLAALLSQPRPPLPSGCEVAVARLPSRALSQ